ncbi:YlmH family RNA-binding protein [Aquibacillus kalidii]|uniref:YlmH family RNA-binding protein n=1 Tax=Aquibacillus kalidii TaxID=2762597 RepID=UPI0016454483|nr:RNA-binding protein [Aquibacillus kalidii]
MDIYQHFRKEEHPFIDQILSWKDEVERYFQPKLTDFLNPREQTIFATIIGKDSDMQLHFFGGNEETERKRAILAPFYETITVNDFETELLEATYPTKFISLEHRDVLGAFLSTGIKRKKMGDLLVADGTIQIIVSSELVSYIKMNLTDIKKASVTFEEQSFDKQLEKKEAWIAEHTTVSSLRLDAVLKEIYNISRQNAVSAIQKGLVKVNFQLVDNPSFKIEPGDLLSMRGKGRSKLSEIHGLSKKDKWKVTYEKLK